MRRKKLKAYWARLKELQKRDRLTRDELLLAIGAAKEKAGRNAQRLVILHLPNSKVPVTAATFRFELDPAVRQVADITRHLELAGDLQDGVTEPDPLHMPREVNAFVMYFGHW